MSDKNASNPIVDSLFCKARSEEINSSENYSLELTACSIQKSKPFENFHVLETFSAFHGYFCKQTSLREPF